MPARGSPARLARGRDRVVARGPRGGERPRRAHEGRARRRARGRRPGRLQRADDGARVRRRRVLDPRGRRLLLPLRGSAPVPDRPRRRAGRRSRRTCRAPRTATRTAASRRTARSGSASASATRARARAASSTSSSSLPTDGSAEPRIVAGGRDFYSSPRISPDGAQALVPRVGSARGCRGTAASSSSPTSRATARSATPSASPARDGEESIWQPDWTPAGDLVFASDRSGWWNLERIRGARAHDRATRPRPSSGIRPGSSATSSCGFLGDSRIACCYDRDGRTHFAILDPETGDLEPLELEHRRALGRPRPSAPRARAVLLVAGSATTPNCGRRCTTSRTARRRRSARARRCPVDRAYFSVPRAIEFPTEGGRTAHALFYPPTNPEHEAPEGEAPPLVVMSHGGPTGSASAIFDLEHPVLDEPRLRGRRRELRRLDRLRARVPRAAERAVGRRRPRGLRERGAPPRRAGARRTATRLLIRGGSRGRLHDDLRAHVHDEFAAGASYFGIADLEQFAGGETHKFELEYEHTLVGPYPEAAELYRERSPIHFVDRIETPMLVLQGAEDKIVPPSQAELIVGRARASVGSRTRTSSSRARATGSAGRRRSSRRSRPSSRSTRRSWSSRARNGVPKLAIEHLS